MHDVSHRPCASTIARLLTAVALLVTGLVVGAAAPAQAATTCSSVWYTIEVGNNPHHYVRPSSGLPNAPLYGNGTEAQMWANLFQLCRDPGWTFGDYALRANYGGAYVRVNPATQDLVLGDGAVHDTTNLLRIRNYDNNFQTLWSPSKGLYVGPDSGPAHQLSASTPWYWLNGGNLYRVRSRPAPPAQPAPPSMPCDPYGPC